MTPFILAPEGVVHGGDAPCKVASDSVNRRQMPIRPGHVIVYHLDMCPACWTPLNWERFMLGLPQLSRANQLGRYSHPRRRKAVAAS
jgi:hypothetical protein